MTIAVLVLVIACVLKTCASAGLDYLNMCNVRVHSKAVPEAFKSFMDFETYAKSTSYTEAKIKFSIVGCFFDLAVLLALLVSGAFPIMFNYFLGIFGSGFFAQALTLIAIMVVISIPSLPFDYYEQFVIEQKFGFNKSSVSLWITDKIKGFIVMLVLCTPICALILWFASEFENTWWIWAFVAVALFQIVMIIVYPMFIVPLFNKLEDLPEGELRTSLFELANRGKFFAKNIQVIDGSRRSSHSNAYFTGFGKFRRIVLFDTLVEQLERIEIEAVLAHEIGHYRKGHITKMILTSFLTTFVMFALMGYIANSDWFYTQFGFEKSEGFGSVLLMYSLFAGAFMFWFAPITNFFSRKHEYEADAFASELCNGGESLISALKKLHKKNLGNLTPHPLYSAFHYSHPTLAERMNALEKLSQTKNEE